MFLTRAIAAAVVASVFLAACASCSRDAEPSTSDGGAPRDGGRLTDSGIDAGNGILYVDAGTPPDFDAAAFDPFLGTWNPLPSRPTGCTVRYAANPAVSVPPLTWAACASGRVGCRKLVIDWPRNPGRSLAFPLEEPMRLVNGKVYFEYIKLWPVDLPALRDFEAYMYGITQLDGPPAFAIADVKESTGCAAEIGFGDYGIAIDATTDPTAEMFGWAPWSNPTNVTAFLYALPSGTTGTDLSLSNTQLFVSWQPPGASPLHLSDGGLVAVETPTAFQGYQTVPTADGAFSTGTATANFLRNDGSWNPVVNPQGSNVVSWVSLDRANGNALVWVEATSGGGGIDLNPTIWTSPYATTSAGIIRREVAAIADTNQQGLAGLVVNAGVALSVTGPSTAVLTRLSDGMGWTIAPESGDALATPLWADDNEVVIAVGAASDPSYTADLTGIMRVTRASLGAPTVPRGF